MFPLRMGNQDSLEMPPFMLTRNRMKAVLKIVSLEILAVMANFS